jgi:hypothetical protein
VIRIGPDNTMGPIATLLSPDMSRTVAQLDYAVAGSTGMAIIQRESGQYQAPYNVYTATFDPVTLSGGAIWAGTDPYATYRFITADGQAHVSGEAGGMFGSNDTQVAAGIWAALGGAALLNVGAEVTRHSSSSFVIGSSESSNAPNNRFTGRQQAAVAALHYFFPFSQLTNTEYGGSVCKTSAATSTPYSYSEPNKGTPETVPPSGCGAGLTIESWYHTPERRMKNPESNLEPLRPAVRRWLRLTVAAIAVLVLMVLLAVGGYVALISGWHPIPSTTLGCSLHKRFHSFSGSPVTKSENLGLATDCLKVTISGRDQAIRDIQKIAAIRAWFDSRSDLWVENFLNAPDQHKPLIVIRACNQAPGTSETSVYLDEDWIGLNPSKRFQRPICRGEWKEMAAIITGANP